MKKLVAVLMVLVLAFSFAGCSKSENENNDNNVTNTPEVTVTDAPAVTEAPVVTEEPEVTEAPVVTEEPEITEAPAESSVMSYAEYIAAEIDTPVVVETYVQAKQSWWDDKATVYTQDENGGYFLYNMACSAEDYEKLVPGTKIVVTGYKSEWAGEVEIVDATFEIAEGNFVATAEDVTALLGTDELIDNQNKFVAFKGMTVEPIGDGEAFLYKWDGSGVDGDDLYFNVSKDGNTYNFTVESYLCDNTTDVYAAVKNLNVGDVIDMEGFLYWYEGVNPHITSVVAAGADVEVVADEKSEGVMTYAEYIAAEIDTPVVVETYVQAKQSWWNDTATVYTQDLEGGYFLYNMACSEEDYAKLVPGTKIRVTGYKSEWAGEVEIVDSTFEILDGNYVAPAVDVTEFLGTEELVLAQNMFVQFSGMTVEDAGEGAAFLYKWDGSGVDGDDLYFKVSKDGNTYTFTVESYLCDNTTDVYAAVKNLNVGDVIDMEGFLYWYEGVNPHITAVAIAE